MTEADAVLVGYAEVGTKSSEVRTKMAERLAANVRALLDARDVAGDVDRRWSRLVVGTARPRRVAEAVTTLPGVAFARPVVVTAPTVESVCDALEAVARDHPADETFAVEGRRVGPADRHGFSSRDLEIDGGSVIEAATGATVNLDDPDRTYRVEVRDDEAFVAVGERRAGTGRRASGDVDETQSVSSATRTKSGDTAEFDGPGGLPVGTQGRVAVLVSGGIDSPVAAWRLMRRGCVPVPVYVDLGDYGGADHRARAFEVIRTLAARAPGEDLRPRVVDGSDVVDRLVSELGATRMLSLRRAMLVMAEAVARREGAHAVATGEALGQKSSQTGANLAVTDAATTLPVHRPLLTEDKPDITNAARRLGTFHDSTLSVGCERVAPSHPETNATLEEVVAAEPDGLLDAARRAGEDATVAERR